MTVLTIIFFIFVVILFFKLYGASKSLNHLEAELFYLKSRLICVTKNLANLENAFLDGKIVRSQDLAEKNEVPEISEACKNNSEQLAEVAAKEETIPERQIKAPHADLSGIYKEEAETGAGVKSFFEDYVVSKIFLWIGGLALVLSGFFLAKYSIERGFLTPLMRVCSSGIFAAILLCAAEFSRKFGERKVSGTLAAASMAVAYGSFYASSILYELMSPALGFAGASACMIVTLLLMRRYGSGMIYLAALGAFMAPEVFAVEAPSIMMLLLYLGVATFAILRSALVYKKPFAILFAMLFNFFWIIYICDLINSANGRFAVENLTWLFIYLIVASILFYTYSMRIEFSYVAKFMSKYVFDFDNEEELKVFGQNFFIGAFPFFALLVCYFSCSGFLREISIERPFLIFTHGILFSGLVYLSLRVSFLKYAMFVAAIFYAIVISPYNIIAPKICCDYLMLAGVSAAILALMFFRSKKEKDPLYLAALLQAFLIPQSFRALLFYDDIYHHLFIASCAISLVSYLLLKKREEKFPDFTSRAMRITSFAFGLFFAFYALIEFSDYAVSSAFVGVFALLIVFASKRYGEASAKDVAAGAILALPFLLERNITKYAQLPLSMSAPMLGGLAFLIAIYLAYKYEENSLLKNIFAVFAVFMCGMCASYFGASFCSETGESFSYCQVSLAFVCMGCVALLSCKLGRNSDYSGFYYTGIFQLFLTIFFTSSITLHLLFNEEFVPGNIFVNWLWISILPILAFSAIFAAKLSEGVLRICAFCVCVWLAFLFVNFQMRFCFQGNFLNGETSMLEFYSYSLLWLVFGGVMLFAGFIKKSASLRYASLVFVLLAIAKVFAYDASNLDGILRVLSFGILGLALLGVGIFYSKYVFKREEN